MKYAVDCVGGTVGANVVKSLGVDGVALIYGRLSPDPFTIQSGAIIFKVSSSHFPFFSSSLISSLLLSFFFHTFCRE